MKEAKMKNNKNIMDEDDVARYEYERGISDAINYFRREYNLDINYRTVFDEIMQDRFPEKIEVNCEMI